MGGTLGGAYVFNGVDLPLLENYDKKKDMGKLWLICWRAFAEHKSRQLSSPFLYVRRTLCNSNLYPVDLESERKYSINIVGVINRLTFHATNIGN